MPCHRAESCRQRDALADEIMAGVAIPMWHVRWQRRYGVAARAAQVAAATRMATPTVQSDEPVRPPAAASFAPARKPMPAVAASSEPVPPASVPAPPLAAQVVDAPAFSMTDAPTPAASSRRACGQCQAELRARARFCGQCGAVFGV